MNQRLDLEKWRKLKHIKDIPMYPTIGELIEWITKQIKDCDIKIGYTSENEFWVSINHNQHQIYGSVIHSELIESFVDIILNIEEDKNGNN